MQSIEVFDGPIRTIPHELIVCQPEIELVVDGLHRLDRKMYSDKANQHSLIVVAALGVEGEILPEDIAVSQKVGLINEIIRKLERHQWESDDPARLRGTNTPMVEMVVSQAIEPKRGNKAQRMRSSLADPLKYTWAQFEEHRSRYPDALEFRVPRRPGTGLAGV